MTKWMTSGARRLKANLNRSFGARKDKKAAAVARDRSHESVVASARTGGGARRKKKRASTNNSSSNSDSTAGRPEGKIDEPPKRKSSNRSWSARDRTGKTMNNNGLPPDFSSTGGRMLSHPMFDRNGDPVPPAANNNNAALLDGRFAAAEERGVDGFAAAAPTAAPQQQLNNDAALQAGREELARLNAAHDRIYEAELAARAMRDRIAAAEAAQQQQQQQAAQQRQQQAAQQQQQQQQAAQQQQRAQAAQLQQANEEAAQRQQQRAQAAQLQQANQEAFRAMQQQQQPPQAQGGHESIRADSIERIVALQEQQAMRQREIEHLERLKQAQMGNGPSSSSGRAFGQGEAWPAKFGEEFGGAATSGNDRFLNATASGNRFSNVTADDRFSNLNNASGDQSGRAYGGTPTAASGGDRFSNVASGSDRFSNLNNASGDQSGRVYGGATTAASGADRFVNASAGDRFSNVTAGDRFLNLNHASGDQSGGAFQFNRQTVATKPPGEFGEQPGRRRASSTATAPGGSGIGSSGSDLFLNSDSFHGGSSALSGISLDAGHSFHGGASALSGGFSHISGTSALSSGSAADSPTLAEEMALRERIRRRTLEAEAIRTYHRLHSAGSRSEATAASLTNREALMGLAGARGEAAVASLTGQRAMMGLTGAQSEATAAAFSSQRAMRGLTGAQSEATAAALAGQRAMMGLTGAQSEATAAALSGQRAMMGLGARGEDHAVAGKAQLEHLNRLDSAEQSHLNRLLQLRRMSDRDLVQHAAEVRNPQSSAAVLQDVLDRNRSTAVSNQQLMEARLLQAQALQTGLTRFQGDARAEEEQRRRSLDMIDQAAADAAVASRFSSGTRLGAARSFPVESQKRPSSRATPTTGTPTRQRRGTPQDSQPRDQPRKLRYFNNGVEVDVNGNPLPANSPARTNDCFNSPPPAQGNRAPAPAQGNNRDSLPTNEQRNRRDSLQGNRRDSLLTNERSHSAGRNDALPTNITQYNREDSLLTNDQSNRRDSLLSNERSHSAGRNDAVPTNITQYNRKDSLLTNDQSDRRDSLQGNRRDSLQGNRRDSLQGNRRDSLPTNESGHSAGGNNDPLANSAQYNRNRRDSLLTNNQSNRRDSLPTNESAHSAGRNNDPLANSAQYNRNRRDSLLSNNQSNRRDSLLANERSHSAGRNDALPTNSSQYNRNDSLLTNESSHSMGRGNDPLASPQYNRKDSLLTNESSHSMGRNSDPLANSTQGNRRDSLLSHGSNSQYNRKDSVLTFESAHSMGRGNDLLTNESSHSLTRNDTFLTSNRRDNDPLNNSSLHSLGRSNDPLNNSSLHSLGFSTHSLGLNTDFLSSMSQHSLGHSYHSLGRGNALLSNSTHSLARENFPLTNSSMHSLRHSNHSLGENNALLGSSMHSLATVRGNLNASSPSDGNRTSLNNDIISKFLAVVVSRVPEIAPALADLLPDGGDPLLLKREFPAVVDVTLRELRKIQERNSTVGDDRSNDLYRRVTNCIAAIEPYKVDMTAADNMSALPPMPANARLPGVAAAMMGQQRAAPPRRSTDPDSCKPLVPNTPAKYPPAPAEELAMAEAVARSQYQELVRARRQAEAMRGNPTGGNQGGEQFQRYQYPPAPAIAPGDTYVPPYGRKGEERAESPESPESPEGSDDVPMMASHKAKKRAASKASKKAAKKKEKRKKRPKLVHRTPPKPCETDAASDAAKSEKAGSQEREAKKEWDPLNPSALRGGASSKEGVVKSQKAASSLDIKQPARRERAESNSSSGSEKSVPMKKRRIPEYAKIDEKDDSIHPNISIVRRKMKEVKAKSLGPHGDLLDQLFGECKTPENPDGAQKRVSPSIEERVKSNYPVSSESKLSPEEKVAAITDESGHTAESAQSVGAAEYGRKDSAESRLRLASEDFSRRDSSESRLQRKDSADYIRRDSAESRVQFPSKGEIQLRQKDEKEKEKDGHYDAASVLLGLMGQPGKK